MSTILEVLRKAQEEARPKAGGVGEVPGGLLDGARRRRRRFAWTAVIAVLVVGFAGGWWIGSRPRSDAPELVAADDAATEPQAAIAPEAERAAEPAVSQPAEAPPPAPPAQPARVERKPIPAAPTDAGVAARSDAQPATGARDLARVAPAPVDGAPPRSIGERQPPPYVEQQPGPSGEGTPRLRPIPRPGTRAGADLDGASPVAPPPAGNAVAQAPTMPVAPGSFRDADEVRLEPEPAPAPAAPAGRESPSELRSRRAAIADRGLSAASPVAPANPERGAVGATRQAEQPSRVSPAGEEARLASLPPASPPASVVADPDAALLASALRRAPNGAPDVVINIVQWSATPTRRFAYVRVGGSQMMQVHEGDEIGGLTVKRIFQQAVEFAHGGSSFVLRAN